MFGKDKPQITGQWQYGSDDSQHKLGIATTDRPGYVALGSDKHDEPLFVTQGQIASLANDVQRGEFRTVLAP